MKNLSSLTRAWPHCCAALFSPAPARRKPTRSFPTTSSSRAASASGFDCVNNESFGFDTLILKENNLRIFFNDTSVSAGFPANDWRLVANDSASGGANMFAIEDATAGRNLFAVTAGAPDQLAVRRQRRPGGLAQFGTAARFAHDDQQHPGDPP